MAENLRKERFPELSGTGGKFSRRDTVLGHWSMSRSFPDAGGREAIQGEIGRVYGRGLQLGGC